MGENEKETVKQFIQYVLRAFLASKKRISKVNLIELGLPLELAKEVSKIKTGGRYCNIHDMPFELVQVVRAARKEIIKSRRLDDESK
jgi:hypothetical protein